MVTRIARPERMIRAMNVHVDGVILSWKRSNPSIIANFAIKPESGGRPDSNNEQKMKPPPSMAIVAGLATANSSSSSSKTPTYSSSKPGGEIGSEACRERGGRYVEGVG